MPVLGYDIAGSSNYGNDTYIYGNVDITDALGGWIRNFHVAIAAIHATEKNVKIAIANVDQSTGNPVGKTVVEQGEFTVAVSNDNSFPAPTSEDLLASTKYFIGAIVQNDSTKYKYDSVPMQGWYKAALVYADQFPSPMEAMGPEGAYSWSIWIDYQHPGVLGYDTAGASQRGNDNVARGTPSQTDGIGGIIKTWHCAIGAIGSPADVKLAVYNCDQGTGDPSTKDLVEQVEYVVAVSDDESKSAMSAESVEADTWYLLCIIMKNANTLIKYDNFGGDKAYWYKVCVYADQYPDPADAGWTGGAASLYSIWVDYEPPTTGILGYDIAGASTMHGYNTIRGNNDITDVEGGVIQNFHLAIGQASTGDFKVGVAKTSGGDPSEQDMVEQAATISGYVTDDFLIAASKLCLLEADTTYYLCVVTNSINDRMKYDAVVGWDYYSLYISLPWGDMIPDPIPAAMQYLSGYAVSVWVDYQHPGILGYSIAGVGGSHGIIDQYRGSTAVTDGIGGKIMRFHAALAVAGSVNKNIKMGIANCAQGDGDPSNCSLIEQVEFEVELSDDEWADATGDNDVLADTKYYIAFAVPNTNVESKIKYDVAPECWYDWGWAYSNVFPATLDVAHVNSQTTLYSIWIDYEAVGGEEFIRSISDTIGITDNLLRSITFARKITDIVSISDMLAATRIRVRKIVDTIGITDVLKVTVTIARKVDSFGVCQIVKIEKKLVSAVRRVNLSGISNIVQSMPYKNSKINEAKENMKPTISRVKGIKNE